MGSGVKRSEAIKRFLLANTHPDLANLYTHEHEVQVNVAKGDGERVDSLSHTGTKSLKWTDGVQTWGPIRMPRKAMSEPEDNDYEIQFDLTTHAEAIGLTGWNWAKRQSEWFAFDFDAISGHSTKHTKKLSEVQLEAVKQSAFKLPWITVRKSTGGKGFHFYVRLKTPVPTANHTEHAALARAILNQMSALAGHDFDASVDVCGQNIWIWGRKMKGTDGLTLVKQGEDLENPPADWRDHVRVTSSRGKLRNLPHFIPDNESEKFEEMAGQSVRVPLDDEHRKLIDYLESSNCQWFFNSDLWMLVCCSYDLKLAHHKLRFKGPFDTLSEAKDGGLHNTYLFPLRYGAWVARRYTKGTVETPNWDADTNGYTRCYYNREPDLEVSARSVGGLELEKGGFEFLTSEAATKAALMLGAKIELPTHLAHRTTILKAHKDGRLVAKVKREASDPPLPGWREEKDNTWTRIFNVVAVSSADSENRNYDDFMRHIISEAGEDLGWVVKGDQGTWNIEPLTHIKSAMASTGATPKQSQEIIGASVLKPWRIVNLPFQPEYPGDRRWNRNSAQFRFTPSVEAGPNSFPHWSLIFRHVGASLDYGVMNNAWCKENEVLSGYDYLILWAASLFKNPRKPLPYLFFYGEQNCGKSSLHEALALMFDRKIGYIRADAALISPSAFNGELENSVLCVIEETDLSKQSSVAYNRIKDWVTSPDILIHVKGETPKTNVNTCHFVHVANKREECPIFRGDTRMTVGRVNDFVSGQEIERDTLRAALEKEAPDFLGYLLSKEIPQSGKRLAIPALENIEKEEAARENMSPVELFIAEKCYRVTGEAVLLGDFYFQFKSWLEPNEAETWTKQRMTKELPSDVPKGRYKTAHWHLGNISFTPAQEGKPLKPRLVTYGEQLQHETTAK